MAFAPLVCIAVVTAAVAAAQPSTARQPERPASAPAVEPAPVAPVGALIATSAVPEGVTPVTAVTQTPRRDSMANDCGWEWNRDGYTGLTSHSLASGVTFRQFRHEGHDRTIVNQTGDVKACMFAEGVDGDRNTPPSQWLANGRRVRLSATRGGIVQRMEIARDGGERTTWTVGGVERPVDSAARLWRDQAVAYLDAAWELGHLRGQIGSLSGDIASIHGQRSSLLGDISSLHGEVSSMRGEISSVRGEESGMRGQISAIHGELSSIQGRMSSELGAISGLQASRHDGNREMNRVLDRIDEHRRNVTRLQREIRDFNAAGRVAAIEQRMAKYDSDGRVAAIEARIKAYNLDGKVADIERQIAALNVEGRVRAIEEEIRGLAARERPLEGRIEEQARRFESAMAAVR